MRQWSNQMPEDGLWHIQSMETEPHLKMVQNIVFFSDHSYTEHHIYCKI